MSLWQFAAQIDGYIAANSPDDKSLSNAEIDHLSSVIDRRN